MFISYAREDDGGAHADAVRQLWEFLRRVGGIDARLDLGAEALRRDWSQWMADEIRDADHVVVVASPAYKVRAEGRCDFGTGKGVQWEARLIRDAHYRDQRASNRFIPVILPGQSVDGLPDFMTPSTTTVYRVDGFTIDGAESLLRILTGQPAVVEPPVGTVPSLPPRPAKGSVRTEVSARHLVPGESLTSFVEGEMSAAEREWASRHVIGCARCRALLPRTSGNIG